jgi:hypothetical protein
MVDQAPPPMVTHDLDGSTKVLADRLETRLQAGNEKFQQWGKIIAIGKYLAAALTPLIIAGFSFAVWALSLAKKSDVSAVSESEVARHVDLERRVSIIEAQRIADGVATAKAIDIVTARLNRIDDVLLDIRLRLGAPPVIAPPPGVKK